MYNDYMFDYDTVTDMFSLYIYRSFKATIICKMTLDKFEKVYMEYLNNARQKQDFTDFVNKVRNANEGFNGEIQDRLLQICPSLLYITLIVSLHIRITETGL